jgi:hypothetical protein
MQIDAPAVHRSRPAMHSLDSPLHISDSEMHTDEPEDRQSFSPAPFALLLASPIP